MTEAPLHVLADLRSPDENRRRDSLVVLSRLRDLRAVPDLRVIEATDDSLELRFLAKQAILHLAGALPEGERERSVRAPLMDDPDPLCRVRSVCARAARGKPEDLSALSARVDLEQDPSVRPTLALAIGVCPGEGQWPILERLLDDPSGEVRVHALEAMTLSRQAAAYPYLVRHADDPDERLREVAARGLSRLGQQNVLRLCSAMCRASTPWMVVAGVRGLAGLHDPAHLSLLDPLLGHPVKEVAAAAREAIERLAREGCAEAIRALARPVSTEPPVVDDEMESVLAGVGQLDHGPHPSSEPDPAARLAQVVAVERRGDRRGVPWLLQRLDQESDSRVLAAVIAVLGRLGDATVLDVLASHLEAKNDRVRANAVEAVGRLTAPELRRSLLRFLDDPHHRVRTNAVLALWGQGCPGVREALISLGTAHDRQARLAAIYAIQQIGEPAAGQLCDLMRDVDPEVSRSARQCWRMLGLGERVGPGVAAAAAAPRQAGDGATKEGYMDRLGQAVVAPPEVCPLIADITAARTSHRRLRRTARLHLASRQEALGREVVSRRLWHDQDVQPLLSELCRLDALIEAASLARAPLEARARRVRRLVLLAVTLSIVGATAVAALLLLTR
ncbi:MAG: HEAT repeat domain-containing protein [Candidatus Riflebacteria bacterium]|nr:HEAT repeat domain-containing protein [Candidatus Riflebacteria bacterium]